ncbi:MAG TPA: hypothetical protein PLZ68_04435 [Ferruginibacter sp.]|nr:hypothetical protein [Ferruginibacter sp.]
MKDFIKIRMLLLAWSFLAINQVSTAQPAINRIEYYIDADPGYGNGTNLSFAGTTNATATLNLDIAPLSQGVHMVGIRSRDANGAWSIDNKWLFLKPFSNIVPPAAPNINRVEWYIDRDPGYGNGTPISITAAQNLQNLAINIDLIPLAQGVHIVGIRSRDANGAWSIDNKWLFLKPFTGVAAPAAPNINRVEWFLDKDPGYGNGTAISITAAQNLQNLAINIDLTPLAQGVHIVGIRSRDANGGWSLDNKWIFLKPYTGVAATPVPKVVRVEYYVDTDPGYGRATPVTITAATNIANLIFDADISTVPNGVHKLGFRVLDEYGAWGMDNKIDFTGGTLSNNTYQWVGNTSIAWNNPANWSTNLVPGAANPVLIPANRPFSPTVANGVTANCKSITVQPGASITVATGGNLRVNQ